MLNNRAWPSTYSDVVTSVASGASSHARGVALLLTHRSVLMHCVPCAMLTLATAVGTATAVWLPLLLTRLWPLRMTVEYESVLRVTSLLVLQLTQSLWPSLSGRVFFTALEACGGAGEARRLRDQPKLRGLGAQLRALAFGVVASVGVAALCIATSALWLPLIAVAWAPIAAVLIVLSPWLIAVLLAGAALTLLALCRLVPALRTYGLLRQLFSLALVAGMLLGYACGLVPRRAVDLLIQAAWAYLLASAHGQAALTQLSIRQTDAAWRRWCAERRWRLVGLGLPVWAVLSSTHPCICLAVLEVSHVSAAHFLHESRSRDELRGV